VAVVVRARVVVWSHDRHARSSRRGRLRAFARFAGACDHGFPGWRSTWLVETEQR
jgi:hypothetical protein